MPGYSILATNKEIGALSWNEYPALASQVEYFLFSVDQLGIIDRIFLFQFNYLHGHENQHSKCN